jgi:hypothetical protein
MSILVLKLPDIKGKKEERPKECPHCAGVIFRLLGQVKKPARAHKPGMFGFIAIVAASVDGRSDILNLPINSGF